MPGAKTITDLMVGTDGLVYGLADSVDLFVFNPNNRQANCFVLKINLVKLLNTKVFKLSIT